MCRAGAGLTLWADMDLMGIIREYCRLQGSLVAAFLAETNPRDERYFLDVGRRGAVSVDGRKWDWHRHGGGVAFVDAATGETVDPHVGMVESPEAFDAWRLVTYLQSKGIAEVSYGSSSAAVADELEVERLIEIATASGVLTPSDDAPPLYTLSQGPAAG